MMFTKLLTNICLSCKSNLFSYKFGERFSEMFRMNHKYDIDWLIAWIMCQRLGILKVNENKLV